MVMALLSPLGLLLPKLFNGGDAWGEWGEDTLEKLLGYVPEGIKQYAGLWKAPMPDYTFGDDALSQGLHIGSYIVSALLGLFIAALVIYGIAKLLVRHEK